MSQIQFPTRREAAWAICNYAKWGDKKQVLKLIEAGVITPLCGLLPYRDSKTICVVLDGLHSMLATVDGSQLEQIIDVIEECGGKLLLWSCSSMFASRHLHIFL